MLKLVRRLFAKSEQPISLYTEVPHQYVETRARAYVNHGEWKADCPRTDCANAMQLRPHQGLFNCSYCHALAAIEWPDEADDIWAVLSKRPVPSTRNWLPANHELALAAGIEHGQSVHELADENAEHGII